MDAFAVIIGAAGHQGNGMSASAAGNGNGEVLQMLCGIYQMLERSLAQSDRIEKKLDEVEKRVGRLEAVIQREREESTAQGGSSEDHTISDVKCEAEKCFIQERPGRSRDAYMPATDLTAFKQENWNPDPTELTQDENIDETDEIGHEDPLRMEVYHSASDPLGFVLSAGNQDWKQVMRLKFSHFKFTPGLHKLLTNTEMVPQEHCKLLSLAKDEVIKFLDEEELIETRNTRCAGLQYKYLGDLICSTYPDFQWDKWKRKDKELVPAHQRQQFFIRTLAERRRMRRLRKIWQGPRKKTSMENVQCTPMS